MILCSTGLEIGVYTLPCVILRLIMHNVKGEMALHYVKMVPGGYDVIDALHDAKVCW